MGRSPRGRASSRLVLGYWLSGPLLTLLLAGISGSLATGGPWVLQSFQAILGLVLFAILRPHSYDRSAWRAASGVLWLTLPLVLLASASLPFFGSARLDFRSPDLWATAWVACGFCGCFVAAIVSAIPRAASLPVSRPSNDTPTATSTAMPRTRAYLRLGLVLATLIAVVLLMTPAYVVLSFSSALSRSHIGANVPDDAHFHEYLKRDLTAYFSAADSAVTGVEYELLRKAPTQVGIAYPKYYAWVTVRSDRGTVTQGVVRLAAQDGEKFEVSNFLTRDEVLSQSERVEETFPAALNAEIMRRAKRAVR